MPTLPVDIELNYKLPLSWQYDKIEFLGLPHLKDNRPLKLGEIFIPLRFKLSPADKTTFFLPKLLKDHKHLVILGDPGCGKSTLVKQVTHSFSTSSPPNWTKHFGNLLPIPIILRDYRTSEWNNYEDMLRSFISKLDPSIRDLVTVEWLISYLEKGEAIVLLDGIDEIGSAEMRMNLRDKIVWPLQEKFPLSYLVLTSRIIGYEEVKFDGLYGSETGIGHSAKRCYIAPFNDEDIEQFITRWYAARESNAELRREGVNSLKRALAQNDRVRFLASNPSLLTLIALVHRVLANLPSGRAKLYDKITEAYLETIEKHRGVGQHDVTLEEKRRWLARVGWEMQLLRNEGTKNDLLVSHAQVKQWLAEAIAIKRDNADDEAEKFLNYIARRSGLLIPRGVDDAGNDLFSFVHLTFQEYFAALHLAGQPSKRVEQIRVNLTNRYWHETILVLFEVLGSRSGEESDDLVEALLTQATQPGQQQAAAEIVSALLLDDDSGLSLKVQEKAAKFACKTVCDEINDTVIRNLEKLKEASESKFDRWIAQPMTRQLRETTPDQWAREFLLVGDDLTADWPQAVREAVIARSSFAWPPNQIAFATLIGTGSKEVIEWAGAHMPVHYWLAPVYRDSWGFFLRTVTINGREIEVGAISIAELNLTMLFNNESCLPRRRLLAQSAMAMASSGSQILRTSFMVRSLDRTLARFLDRSLDRFLAEPDQNAEVDELRIPLARSLAKSLDRHLDRSLARSLAWSLARPADQFLDRSLTSYFALSFAQCLSVAVASPRLGSEPVPTGKPESAFVTQSAATEWLVFQPDQESERLATIEALHKFLPTTKDNDDWTRLLAINNLITLSAGTPELVAERNRLCDKAMTTPNEFTFPAELREATRNKEWFNLPEIIAIIFWHEPGDPFLKPEWFDPKSEESKFFLSPPREFFALAAEVLDPEGETELAKFRNGKLQNKESSTA